MNIYFIISPDHNKIKIGRTKIPEDRYYKLRKENNPFEIYMIIIRNSPYKEKKLHDIFSNYNYMREWFDGNDYLYQFIQELYDSYDGEIIFTTKRNEVKIKKIPTKRKFTKRNYGPEPTQEQIREWTSSFDIFSPDK